LVGGVARPVHAGKQYNYVMGAICQPSGLNSTPSPLTYTNSGFLNETGAPVEVICPVTWAKPAVPAQLVAYELDVEVDWLPVGIQPLAGACSLSWQSLGGSATMQPFPIPYPVPTLMQSMWYAAVVCTVPSWMGIQGVSFNMCVTTTSGSPTTVCPPL